MNANERKIAYADAAHTGCVLTDTARRNFSGDALTVALAKADAYVSARQDNIDKLFVA